MMNKLLTVAACATVVALTSAANAEQPLLASKKPVALSDRQMDGVTAGTTGIANAAAAAFGEVLADTVTQTSTNTVTVGTTVGPVTGNGVQLLTGRIAIGQAYSQSLAAGGFFFQATGASHADTAAIW